MTDINQIITRIKIGNNNIKLIDQPSESFRQIIQYLYADLKNIESKFSKIEVEFASTVKYILSTNPSGIKKFLPFLMSNTEKTNLQLLKEIDILFEKKKISINSIYEKDILIVNEFLKYTSEKLKKGDIFYFEPYFETYAWTKKDFPKNMYGFLAHRLRTNPVSFTSQYIEELKGHFSLIGLGLRDETKVRKANHYFTNSNDPFSFNIPDTYSDVRNEILFSVASMTENENLLGRIANDVAKKYEGEIL